MFKGHTPKDTGVDKASVFVTINWGDLMRTHKMLSYWAAIIIAIGKHKTDHFIRC